MSRVHREKGSNNHLTSLGCVHRAICTLWSMCVMSNLYQSLQSHTGLVSVRGWQDSSSNKKGKSLGCGTAAVSGLHGGTA
eukprot:10282484-Ditylum_brightwellii.AAC.1